MDDDPRCWNDLAAENARLREANEALSEALLRIRQWCDAYPVEVFTPMTEGEITEAVAAADAAVRHGGTRLHASWARHILDGVKQYTAIGETHAQAPFDHEGAPR